MLIGLVASDSPVMLTSSVIDYFVASAGICCRALSLQVQDMTPDCYHFFVSVTLDMPTPSPPASRTSSQAPQLKYVSSSVEDFQTQLASE